MCLYPHAHKLIILYLLDVDLAHTVDVTIVVNEVQSAAPVKVLFAFRLVELYLQWERQNLAVAKLEHCLHMGPILVLVHLKPRRGPVKHVDQLTSQVRRGRRAMGHSKVSDHLLSLLLLQQLLLHLATQTKRGWPTANCLCMLKHAACDSSSLLVLRCSAIVVLVGRGCKYGL